MPPLIDLTGQRFNRLVVLGKAPKKGKTGNQRWECRCDCGALAVFPSNALRGGVALSCGCSRTKHGFAARGERRARLYTIWDHLKQRCNNPRSKNFKNYGGRGISVCPEWDSFEAFRDWALSSGYADSLQIDRIDTNGDYKPENCRWVSQQENLQNTRRTKLDAVKVKAIRVAAQAGFMTKAEMANFFCVSMEHIGRVIRGKKWSNV